MRGVVAGFVACWWWGRPLRLAGSVLVSLALAGCGTGTAIKQTILGSDGPQLGTSIDVTGFLGGVAADEPEAGADRQADSGP